jgi:hypothetical protein
MYLVLNQHQLDHHIIYKDKKNHELLHPTTIINNFFFLGLLNNFIL